MHEQRKDVRRKTYFGGHIYYANGHATRECLVRNMSATGAKLTLIDTAVLPDRFDLRVLAKGESFCAELKWRRFDVVGVALTRSAQTNVVALAAAAQPRTQDLD